MEAMEEENAFDTMLNEEDAVNLGDLALPTDAQHHAQTPIPALPQAEQVNPQDQWQSILQFLHKMGMNTTRKDDLSDFWGLRLEYKPQAADLIRRFRLASLRLHPDKTGSLHPSVRQWCSELQSVMAAARDEMLRQIEAAEKGPASAASPQHGIPNQEFPEDFQMGLLNCLRPSMIILNTSDALYSPIGCDMVPSKSLSVDDTRNFYLQLLNPETSAEVCTLADLLTKYLPQGVDLEGSSWVLSFTRTPFSFLDWLVRQLELLRGHLQLTIHIVVLCDAFPTQWDNVLKFWDAPAKGPKTEVVRVQQVLIEPCVMTVLIAGFGPIRMLKKPMLVTISSHGEPKPTYTRTMKWRQQLIPAFATTFRLYIDFLADDVLMQRVVAQHLADKYGGERSGHVFRSFGASGNIKRKAVYISFDSASMQDDEKMPEDAYALHRQRNLFPFIGWESLYDVPDESYILTFDDTSFGTDNVIMGMLSEVVLTAKNRG